MSSTLPLDRRRYRRVVFFFARAFLHILWWDGVLNRPLLKKLRREPLPRWKKLAAGLRDLALELGGVMIKLGQFLSTRVDILPPDVAAVLAELQDEVPPAPTSEIVDRIEKDFGRPIDELFETFDQQPVGAASLAQAHRATYQGRDVVIKVLRPGIERIVETDLAAARTVLRWMKWWRPLRQRVNIDQLSEELHSGFRNELDFHREAHQCERFRRQLESDEQLIAPKVFTDRSARSTLALEDVSGLRVSDLKGLQAAGIDPEEVARVLFSSFVRQVFFDHFVHCDPHPGNLFLQPTGEVGGFKIAFIDFGMMAEVPPQLREFLQDFALALLEKDARLLVETADRAGLLLPGADLDRLEEIVRQALDRFLGISMEELRETAFEQSKALMAEFRDLLYQLPFQFPVDLLFVLRGLGLLSGLCTHLDSKFDPWTELLPFTKDLVRQKSRQEFGRWGQEVSAAAKVITRLPVRLDRALERSERQGLPVAVELRGRARRQIEGLEGAVHRLRWTVLAAALFLGGCIMSLSPEADITHWILWVSSAIAGLVAWLRWRS